eukprot:1161358-Pelagomonas_calceolata.AAC.7
MEEMGTVLYTATAQQGLLERNTVRSSSHEDGLLVGGKVSRVQCFKGEEAHKDGFIKKFGTGASS